MRPGGFHGPISQAIEKGETVAILTIGTAPRKSTREVWLWRVWLVSPPNARRRRYAVELIEPSGQIHRLTVGPRDVYQRGGLNLDWTASIAGLRLRFRGPDWGAELREAFARGAGRRRAEMGVAA